MVIVYTYRDTMSQDSNILGEKINVLLETLGMQKEDIKNIIYKKPFPEQLYCTKGPWIDDPYWASYYGTISIKDF